jgi:hypothetical protein
MGKNHWYLSVIITPPKTATDSPVMMYILDGFYSNIDVKDKSSKTISAKMTSYIKSLCSVAQKQLISFGSATTFPIQNDQWLCGYFVVGWLMKFAKYPELLYKSPLTIMLQRLFVEDTQETLIAVFRELAASDVMVDKQEEQTCSDDTDILDEDIYQHQIAKKVKQKVSQQPQVEKKRKREDDKANSKEDNNEKDVQAYKQVYKKYQQPKFLLANTSE